jgi:hypothetical protein
MSSDFATDLQQRIETCYLAGGYTFGWRLLYSPAACLDGAKVAFVGLNPAGNFRPKDHPEFSTENGSAYAVEDWGAPAGTSKLQVQVLALFRMLGERPEAVLAGNLVPFRSPSWDALPGRHDALSFGKDIWRVILSHVNPCIVVAMGGEAVSALRDILHVTRTERIPLNWGKVCGETGDFGNGTLIGIPHLSRFGVITRSASAPGLRRLLSA